MKRYAGLLVILIVLSTIASPLLAAVSYTGNINVTNTTVTNFGVIGCNITMPIANMITTGMLTANGFDSSVYIGSTLPTMLVNDRVNFALNVPATSTLLGTFSTNNSPLLTSYYIIPSYLGYVTTAVNVPITDNATPHNWQIEVKGYFKDSLTTTYALSGGNNIFWYRSAANTMTFIGAGGAISVSTECH